LSSTLLSLILLNFITIITHLENTTTNVSNWMSSNFLSFNPSKTEFLIFGLPKNSLNSIILSFMYLTMSYSHLLILLAILVSSLIKICNLHNISLLFLNHASTIFVTLDVFVILLIKLTACTIVTSLIHSKIDYFNSLLLNLPATQTNRLQLVLNSAARAVTKTPKFHHITPILKSLHWLKINERITLFLHLH